MYMYVPTWSCCTASIVQGSGKSPPQGAKSLYVYIDIYMYMCIYIYIYMYMHNTYIYIYI